MMPMRPLVFACCCMDSGGITRAIASSYAGERKLQFPSTHLHLRIVTVVLLLVPLLTILAFSISTGIPFLSASYSLFPFFSFPPSR